MSDRSHVGSKWWKFDFHNHTPASDDYGKGQNQVQSKQISHKDWLLSYMKNGINCVAVTDHNTGAWIDPLKQALKDLEAEKHPDYKPLALFPGVEITVQGNVHILAILPLDKTTSDIDSLLGAVGYNGTKGKSDDVTKSSPAEVIEKIVSLHGLAIPAHVDQTNGIFTVLKGNTLEQVLNNKHILAIEVIDTTNAKPPLYIDKKLEWSEVLGTDSHHPDGSTGQRFPGSHFTWVKMSEPSIDCLRLALLDGALSLKRSDEFFGEANTQSQLTIEYIAVNEAKYLGRGGQTFTCQLNPWLNTIIGGRGTGKSTSIEFLRAALKRNHEIPQTLTNEFAKYDQVSSSRQDDGLLLDSTIITIGFRKNGVRFKINWNKANNGYCIEEETPTGDWNITEGDITQRFPIRIYSQKQIFELAKHPEALLQVVDDAITVNYRDWKLRWDELLAKYLSIRAQEREVESGLQEEPVIKGQLQDIIHKINIFEEAGHAEILKSYQHGQNKKKAIETWEKSWGNLARQVQEFSTNILPTDIDKSYFSDTVAENNTLLEAVKDIQQKFLTFQKSIRLVSEQMNFIKDEWTKTKESLQVSKNIQTTHQAYNDLLSQLSEADAGDPSEYGKLIKYKQDLEEKLLTFNKKKELLSAHQKNAIECFNQMRAHRADISSLRNKFLNSTLSGNKFVQIKLVPFGNKISTEYEFRNLIDRSTGGFERDIGNLTEDNGLLSILSKDDGRSIDQKIDSIKLIISAIHNFNDPTDFEAKDRRFIGHIQGLKPEQIDRIKCWFPEDALEIKYSLKDGETFKPVEQGSPGQKTAALLAFILSYGDEPLILDQPEDDLDNQLIYNLIVAQLREIKQKRQILIVTHNANIVVNGDAENVIVLDIKNGQTNIVSQGSLQDQRIREEICRVMEGGREAFTMRYKRITASN